MLPPAPMTARERHRLEIQLLFLRVVIEETLSC